MNRKKLVLVTGGTGYLGLHIILQLLKKGYEVRTTVRSMKSSEVILQTLKDNSIQDVSRLSFAEADLSKDEGWAEAVAGCRYVLSVASPVFFEIPKNEADMMRPAVEGILRVLKASRNGHVKRVVMTSNFGAVGFSKKNPAVITTEADWTNPKERGLSAYEKSKLLAEREAWKFIKHEGDGLEFATINPVAILGPALNSHTSGSFVLLNNLLDGTMKRVPPIPLNLVDVRDVAKLHILAMETPAANGERFIASSDGQINMTEMAEIMRKDFPGISQKVSKKNMSPHFINFASHFSQYAREGALLLNMNRNVSNEKAKTLLGWKPRSSNQEIVTDSLKSMIQWDLIK